MSIVQLLLESAHKHATRPAVVAEGVTWSYEQLFGRALTFARTLSAQAPGRCALLVSRRHYGFAAYIGTLLAGMTLVPIRRGTPAALVAARIAHLRPSALIVDDDSDATTMLAATSALPAGALIGHETARPQLHTHRRDLRAVNFGNHRPDSNEPTGTYTAPPEAHAYILYTSGSAGKPRAVAVTRANLTAYLRGFATEYPYTPEDKTTQLFDLTFDLSVHDLLVSWLAGACVYVPARGELLGAVDMVREARLSVWFASPSALSLFERLGKLTPGAMPSLRLALSCGERLAWAQASRLASAAPHSKIVNLYGPTEATIAITHYEVDAKHHLALSEDVPIGHPFRDQAVMLRYSADTGCDDAPDRVGTLMLSGSQIAPGYLEDAEATAQRFRTAAGTDGLERVWYDTGDLVKAIPTHGLIFVGRADDEVKVRGRRIRMTEVETMLTSRLADAWVCMVPWPRGIHGHAEGIALFYASRSRSVSDVSRACAEALPHDLLPSRIVKVDAPPLTANGKLDRGMLHRLLGDETAPRKRQNLE